jgi:hypothetical protein
VRTQSSTHARQIYQPLPQTIYVENKAKQQQKRTDPLGAIEPALPGRPTKTLLRAPLPLLCSGNRVEY